MTTYLTTPFKRRWLLPTLAVIAASLVMVRLGFWQLDRHDQRMAYINGVIAEVEDVPFTLTGGPEDDAYAERIFHQVEADGRFDFDHQIIIKNQYYNDMLGYHLVTPFLIEGSERAVLVDRGWIPPEAVQSFEDVRQFDEPELTHIVGRIMPPEKHRGELPSPENPQRMWYRVSVPAIAAQMPYEVLPFAVALLPPETPQTHPPFRNPPKFKLDPGPHMGYAIQWFIFAIFVPLVYLWQVVRLDRKETTEHF
ncbi:MAG TPA: SURF1 family protein [Anaerolineae bacterium]|nr:SURF1 family protein [Anaerolineae bacterium]